jgi:putative endonuclease
MWYFYVIQSLNDHNYFYKGSTNDLTRRLKFHNDGCVQSTKSRLPYRIVYYEAYLHETAARKRESSIKKSGNVHKFLMKRIKESLKT